jgi:hypothetical protein
MYACESTLAYAGDVRLRACNGGRVGIAVCTYAPEGATCVANVHHDTCLLAHDLASLVKQLLVKRSGSENRFWERRPVGCWRAKVDRWTLAHTVKRLSPPLVPTVHTRMRTHSQVHASEWRDSSRLPPRLCARFKRLGSCRLIKDRIYMHPHVRVHPIDWCWEST